MSAITAAVRAELELLTPDQVCDLLKVKKAWLYDVVEREGFPHVRLGSRQLRFRPADVLAWVDGDRTKPEPEPETPGRRLGRPRKA